MDKAEYHLKLQELTKCVEEHDYAAALSIVESVEWRRVKSIRTLNMVADVYEANRMYRECKTILLLAYDRASIGKSILYRLVEVCLKLGEIEEAVDFYTEFVEVAPHDNSRYILKYKIYRARRSPLQDQIAILEEYKDREYTERWAYELARLYSKAGDQQKCVETCDDMILWFSEGIYVRKAMELKQKYQPLSIMQQAAYQKELEREKLESGQEEQQAEQPQQHDREPAKGETAEQSAAAAAVSAAVEAIVDSREMLQKMDEAGAAITRDVSVPEEQEKPRSDAIDDYSVTSREFMGRTADLREQLAKSIHDVFSGIRKEAPQVQQPAGEAEKPEEERMPTEQLPVHELEQEQVEHRVRLAPKPEKTGEARESEEQQIDGQMSLADFDLEALVNETADSLSAEVASEQQKPEEQKDSQEVWGPSAEISAESPEKELSGQPDVTEEARTDGEEAAAGEEVSQPEA